jgi:RNA polymerase sigma factor (sigma-70 family)
MDSLMDELTTLVLAAQRGDLDAFGQVVERFQKMAYAVAYATVGDAHLAEDAAQEAFIEAYLSLPKLREPAAFPGWFRRIVFKRGDRLIRGKRLATLPIEVAGEVAAREPGPAVIAEARELRRQVQAAIDELPEPDRMLVMLFYLAGYAQQEIAAIAELPVATVKKRLYRARQRLRAQLDGLVREQIREQHSVEEQFARLVQFFIAVRIGDLARVRALLNQTPALLNAHERWDEATARQYGLPIVSWFTALHRAAYNGDSALAALLLDAGADPDARTRGGQTPLHVAALVDRPAIVAQLLAGGADPNAAADHDLTPLHFAVIRDRRAIVRQLLDAGADGALPDWHGRTPLDWARLKGYDELVGLLRRDGQRPPEILAEIGD